MLPSWVVSGGIWRPREWQAHLSPDLSFLKGLWYLCHTEMEASLPALRRQHASCMGSWRN